MSKDNGKEKSIFELDEMAARKILVDAINHLSTRCDRQSRLITEMDENILRLQREVDELESDVDSLQTELDALR